MGVYIPNIKKPNHCTECYFVCRDQCELQDNSYDYDTFKEQKKHCPLQRIDLVRCKECKKSYDVGGEIFCNHLSGMVGCNVLVKPTNFCSYGERRTDEC